MPRGGYQQPSSPAPVSGPGALSQRTDGGPTQPIRVAPGGDYGSRQALEAQQSAAPMRAGGPPPVAPGGASTPPPGGDIFAPTTRPGEPITAGLPIGPGPNSMGKIPDDPYELIRVMGSVTPHPDVLAMLEQLFGPGGLSLA